MSVKIPTERQVLRCIYDMYLPNYPFQPEKGSLGQVMVPIDMDAVASRLGMSRYLLFGYLNSYLDHKWRYKTGENSYERLFAPMAGEMRHAVNFPYLAAILASHDQEYSKFAWSLGVSLVALALSVGAIIAQLAASGTYSHQSSEPAASGGPLTSKVEAVEKVDLEKTSKP